MGFHIDVRIDMSERQKRWMRAASVVLVPAALLVTTMSIGHATLGSGGPPSDLAWIGSAKPVSAANLKANLLDLQGQLTTLEKPTALRYVGTSNGTVAGGNTASATNVVLFKTKSYDTSTAYTPSTGVFRAPSTALYQISSFVFVHACTLATSQGGVLELEVNGSVVAYLAGYHASTSMTDDMFFSGTDTLQLTAGDILTVDLVNQCTNNTSLDDISALTIRQVSQ